MFHDHGLEELMCSKCLYYSKQTIGSVQPLSKFQWHFSQKKQSSNCVEPQKTPKSQSNLKKEEKTASTIVHDFKLYHKVKVIKTA